MFACVCLHPVLSTVHAKKPSKDPVPSNDPMPGLPSAPSFRAAVPRAVAMLGSLLGLCEAPGRTCQQLNRCRMEGRTFPLPSADGASTENLKLVLWKQALAQEGLQVITTLVWGLNLAKSFQIPRVLSAALQLSGAGVETFFFSLFNTQDAASQTRDGAAAAGPPALRPVVHPGGRALVSRWR